MKDWISSSDLKSGYKWCPHCGGKTKCDCGTCGQKVEVPFYYRHKLETHFKFEPGVCSVCKGLGQVKE